jgi:hypothetical protein
MSRVVRAFGLDGGHLSLKNYQGAVRQAAQVPKISNVWLTSA